jgi:hypothetical protein
MENTARLYNCVRCHRQVTICSHCDRGNIYCGKSCADLARSTSLKAAGKRYQRTRRGRFNHAERQRAYRDRHLKLTDESDDLLERINQMVSLPTKNALKRLASYYGVTQRALLESAIANAERALFDTLPGEHQNDYYDMNITLRSNTKQGTSNNKSLTDRIKED